MNERTRFILSWTASVVLALSFGFHAYAKLTQQPNEVAAFTRWGHPTSFMLLVGTLEALATVGLLVLPLRPFAAAGLAALMAGAMMTHARFQEWGGLAFAALHATAALLVTWLERARLRRLLRRPRPTEAS